MTPQCKNCFLGHLACGGFIGCHGQWKQPDWPGCDLWWPREFPGGQVSTHVVHDWGIEIHGVSNTGSHFTMWVNKDLLRLQIDTPDLVRCLTMFRRVEDAHLERLESRLWWLQVAACWASQVQHKM